MFQMEIHIHKYHIFVQIFKYQRQMRMSMYKPTLFFTTCLSALALTGCVNSDELTSSNTSSGNSNPMSEITTKGVEQNWNTIRTINLNIEANDEFVGEYNYKVSVYDTIPIGNSNANELVSGLAKAGQNYNVSFAVPTSLSTIYVKQTDPRNRTQVRAFTLEKGTETTNITASFVDQIAATQKIGRKIVAALTDVKGNIVPKYTSGNIPANAINWATTTQTSFNSDDSSNPTYLYVPAGAEVSSQGQIRNNCIIFVQGKLTLNTSPEQNSKIIVLDGGTVQHTGDFELKNGAQIYIMKGGSANFNKFTPTDTNGNKLVNFGTFYAKTMNNNMGYFYNAQDATFTVEDTYKADQGFQENHGFFYAGAYNGSNQGELHNFCTMTIANKFDRHGGAFYEYGGTVIAASMDISNQTTILYDGSSLRATGSIYCQNVTIKGLGNSRSLIVGGSFDYNNRVYLNGLLTTVGILPKQHGPNSYVLSDGAAVCPSIESVDFTVGTCGGESYPKTDPTPPEETHSTTTVDNSTYSYAFEDNWPSYGDYDMNDLVVYITNRTINSTDNKVTSYTIKGTVMANGAAKESKGLLHLNGIPASSVSSISGIATALESGQSEAIVQLFEEAHKFMGTTAPTFVNTLTNYDTFAPKDFEVTFNFKGDIIESQLNVMDLDLFIATNNTSANGRSEIHLPIFAPTSKANATLNGTVDSYSSEKPYYSKDGLCFAMMIPTKFYWPTEYKQINKVYNYFAAWVESNGEEADDWYNYSQEGYSNTNNIYPVDNLFTK